MNYIITGVIILIIGYAFGCFSTGYFVGKKNGLDIRLTGSGNIGTTNALRSLGAKAGAITFLGDLLKAFIPTLVVKFAFCPAMGYADDITYLFTLLAGLGVVMGHNFPFYMKFKGGKGIASSVGIIFTFDWRMVPICAILFFASVVPTGFMSLGSLGILSGFFVQTIVFGQMGWLKIATQFLPEVYVLTGILTALAFWQHRTNIKRLATGTENKFRPAKK